MALSRRSARHGSPTDSTLPRRNRPKMATCTTSTLRTMVATSAARTQKGRDGPGVTALFTRGVGPKGRNEPYRERRRANDVS